jgi:hypothetical protein
MWTSDSSFYVCIRNDAEGFLYEMRPYMVYKRASPSTSPPGLTVPKSRMISNPIAAVGGPFTWTIQSSLFR